jgi:hypothetical protein
VLLRGIEASIEIYALSKLVKNEYFWCTREYVSDTRITAFLFVCCVTLRLLVGAVEAAQLTELWIKMKAIRTTLEGEKFNVSTGILNVFLLSFCVLCFLPCPYFVYKGNMIYEDFLAVIRDESKF